MTTKAKVRKAGGVERTEPLRMEGGFVTHALRLAYEKGGLDDAMSLVVDGITREDVEAVCLRRARIVGNTRDGLGLERLEREEEDL